MQGPEHPVAAVEEADQLAAGELRERRHRREVRVDPLDEPLRQDGQGGAEPTDLPRAPQATHGRHRVQPSRGAIASA